MNITCKVCKNSLPLKPAVLQKHMGKVVTFKCPHCSNNIRFRVKTQSSSSEKKPTVMETFVAVNSKRVNSGALNGQLNVLRNEHTEEQIFQLTSGKLSVGRLSSKVGAARPDISIKTTDMYMSKLHCIIEVEEQKDGTKEYILKNHQGVKNKIKKDDKILEDYDGIYLKDGDSFKLGRTTILFHFVQ